MSDTTTAVAPRNPWMIALTVTWSLLLGVALTLCLLGANAAAVQLDPGVALGYYAAAAGATGFAVVVGSVQLAVGALRWYLDESSRPARPPRAARPYVRQDF